MDDPEVPINAVKRSYQVADELYERGTAGVTELSGALDLPKSTIHNHLRTLERLGFLVEENGAYRLGTKYLHLGRKARNSRPAFVHGREEVKHLQERTDAFSLLVVEENGMGAILQAPGWDHETMPPTARHVYPTHAHLHTNAPGKAILAHLPQKRMEEVLARHGLPARTDRTVTDEVALREELSVIRQRGYAVDWGEMLEGMAGVAASIVNDLKVYGAVAAYGPVSDIQPGIEGGELAELVMETAGTIHAELVFSHSE